MHPSRFLQLSPRIRLVALLLLFPLAGWLPAQEQPPERGPGQGPGRPGPGQGLSPRTESVSLQFPLNSVGDILSVYERLTGKVVLRDSSIFNGPEVSLVTPDQVPREEAIRLIEAALILNGYVLVRDEPTNTVKILLGRPRNEANTSFNEGADAIYTRPQDLPAGESLVGYFMNLSHLGAEDTATIMTNHVQLNPYGRITPVSSPSGLLITESAAVIRKLIRLQALIDVPPAEARLMTKFVQLKHADANTVAQIIQATMDARYEESQRIQEEGGSVRTENQDNRNRGNNNNDGNNQNNRQATAAGGVIGSASEPAAQLIADDRMNRILVQASPSDLAFILGLIHEFDLPLPGQNPLEFDLRYVKAIDILPVVVDVLTDTGSGTTQLPGGRSIETRQTPVSSSSLASITGIQNEQQQTRFQQQTGTDDTGEQADRLAFPIDEVAPISVLVGKTRVIADRQSNVIIVIGTEQVKKTVGDLLERLDRKPAQVYLAIVIGQLTLGDGIDVGVDYLKQFETFDPTNANSSGLAASLIAGRPDIVTGNSIADVRDNLITNAFGPAGGLNVYGSIGDQLDVFITALETSQRFNVLSRPVVSVQNNKRASITSGQKIPVPEATITDATGGATNAVLNTTIAFENVVLKLEVIPLINADNEVTLEIVQVNDTVIGEQIVSGNSVPIIGNQELTTTVTVPDRETLVLGGLITEQDDKTVEGIPLLKDVPVVGNAFRRTSRTVSRSELLIFIQPVVVRENHEMQDASFDEDVRTEIGADAAEIFPTSGIPTQQHLHETSPGEKEKPRFRIRDTRLFQRLK